MLQKDSMDEDLRNRLWNVTSAFLVKIGDTGRYVDDTPPNLLAIVRPLWHRFLGSPFDTIPHDRRESYKHLRKYFFECHWNEVYDFIELFATSLQDYDRHQVFITSCNHVLEREVSAYRFVGVQIADLTSAEEIESIEQAMDLSGPLKPVSAHLGQALKLLADRKAPDYRNSIKESISAVESVCKLL